jgi:hypothetical protein
MNPPASSDLPRDKAGYDLFLALRQAGCPICRLTAHAVDHYFDAMSYENVNDIELRAQLRAAQGWCAVHGRQWLGQRDALGTAIIYKDVLDTARRTLLQAAGLTAEAQEPEARFGRLRGLMGGGSGPRPGAQVARALEPDGGCAACAVADGAERGFCGAFVGGLTYPVFLEAYRRHPNGICLPHLRAVLRLAQEPEHVQTLVQIEAEHLARTRAALAEVIPNNEERFRPEPRGDDVRAPAQAVEQAAGSIPNSTGRHR